MEIASIGEIYRRKLRKMRFDPETAKELAQEMILLSLERERRTGFDPKKCTFKWLLADALPRVLGKWRLKKGRAVCLIENEFLMSQEEFEDWLASNWCSLSNGNGGNGKPICKYRVSANGCEMTFDANDLVSVLGRTVTASRSVVSNFLKRGAVLYISDGKLVRRNGSCKPAQYSHEIKLSCVGRA